MSAAAIAAVLVVTACIALAWGWESLKAALYARIPVVEPYCILGNATALAWWRTEASGEPDGRPAIYLRVPFWFPVQHEEPFCPWRGPEVGLFFPCMFWRLRDGRWACRRDFYPYSTTIVRRDA